MEAGAVTCGAVRCSAWLGDVGSGILSGCDGIRWREEMPVAVMTKDGNPTERTVCNVVVVLVTLWIAEVDMAAK